MGAAIPSRTPPAQSPLKPMPTAPPTRSLRRMGESSSQGEPLPPIACLEFARSNVSLSALASTAATSSAAATLSTRTMFIRGAMAYLANVPSPVPSLIPLEVVERAVAIGRHWPTVSIARVVAVIHVPVESGTSVVPRSRPDKQSAGKPVRPVIPIRRATVRSIVEVSVRTRRRNADPHHNLRRSCGLGRKHPNN